LVDFFGEGDSKINNNTSKILPAGVIVIIKVRAKQVYDNELF